MSSEGVEEHRQEIAKLKDTVSLLERELSIFRGSEASRKARLSALYVVEEEPSLGELCDEVDSLRTENRRFRLLVSNLEEAKEALEQSKEALEKSLAASTEELAKVAQELKRLQEQVKSEARHTAPEDADVASLLGEVNELRRLNASRFEQNLELRAELEIVSQENQRVLNTSFVDESNSEEFVTCGEETIAVTSR